METWDVGPVSNNHISSSTIIHLALRSVSQLMFRYELTHARAYTTNFSKASITSDAMPATAGTVTSHANIIFLKRKK